ncbi:hypothetical protein PEL8287_01833 [Roseovarius litorisediminis]|uniref:Uncharacterized protein n=1 Tax=Roseovarius litorisediminis TaxID=1312363 RepID=A0A1Y5SD42_9RHOB|nr:hypothetical protein [Roseovarius litorisediminis]SLN37869.1 hypothetical protein PEL8287_01833 [Roseovarius litorisediminis]
MSLFRNISYMLVAVGIVFSSGVVTLAQGECPTAPGKADPSWSDEQARTHSIKMYKHGLCSYQEIRKNSERIRTSADDAVFDWVNEYFNDLLKLVETRSTYPSKMLRDRFETSERFKDHQARWWDVITYIELSKGIYVEENCEQKGSDGLCVGNPYIQMALAQGKTPRQELERTAHAPRPLFADPWFLLGDVIVDDSELSEKSFLLRHANRQAKKAYDLAKETRDMRWQELGDAAEAHEENATAIRAPVDKLKRKIVDILDRYGRSDEEIENSDPFRRLEVREAAIRDRLGEIEKAVDYLFKQYPADDEFANTRMQELDEEARPLEAELAQIATEREEIRLPDIPDADRNRLKMLRDDLELVERDAERRIARDRENYLTAKRLHEGAQERLDAAERAHAKADVELREFMDETRFVVTSVWTNDAEIELDFDSITKIMKIVEADLKDNVEALEQLKRVRERAREAMIDAADDVDFFADELLSAGYYALALQLTVEWADAARKLIQSAKAGPVGVGVELVNQFVTNIIFEPSYYEYKGGRLDDYRKGESPWLNLGMAETIYPGELLDSTIKRAAKDAVGFLFKLEKQNLTSQQLQKMIRGVEVEVAGHLQRFSPEGYKQTLKLLTDKSVLVRSLKESDLALSTLTGQQGKRAFAGKVGANLLKGLAVSLAKEELKKAANLIEQDEYDNYMMAQIYLSKAVGTFRKAGNDYWAQLQIVKIKRYVRDALIEGYNPEEQQFEGKNLPFFADPGYQISLDVEEEFEGQFKAKVTLGGITLERDLRRSTPVWKLPDDSLELFTSDMPERLELKIVLK